MRTYRLGPLSLSAFAISMAISVPVSAASITVTNVKPQGQVTSNSIVTITADVVVTGLPDGTYLVDASITNDNPARRSSNSYNGQ